MKKKAGKKNDGANSDSRANTDSRGNNNDDANIALYRKYRPQKFSEVLGQEQVIGPLSAALEQGNIAHAYLFAGSRGTGKTSVARILARTIGTADRDLYEIDAASNTSVEDIRALNESVATLPYESSYKVYILDEVHMLSTSAFNALLKTLEEPPRHVVFVLATTEPQKIPETVVSRCEAYTFQAPNRALLKKIATETAKAEGYELEPAAAELIAILGDGSFRDTLTTLQKLTRASADKKLAIDEVERVTGAPQVALINQVVRAIVSQNLEDGLAAIETLKTNNIDVKVFMKLLLEKVRIALLLRVAPNRQDLYEDLISTEDLSELSALIKENSCRADDRAVRRIGSKTLSRLLQVYDEALRAPLPYLPLELALIDFATEKE